jgi:MFS-type transporter involved in bile tolerance (Atg22 family)
MNAIVSIAIAPLVGHLSDRTRRKNTLMQSAYLIHVVGTAVTAWATTGKTLTHVPIGKIKELPG